MSPIDMEAVFKSPYSSRKNLLEPTVTSRQIDLALADREERIDSLFKIPREIDNSVRFWLRIYTEFTTQHVVIFDEQHQDIIYTVLDFRDLAKTARNRAAYEITAERRVKATLKLYKDTLLGLSLKKGRPDKLSPLELRVKRLISKSHHRYSSKEFAKRVRAQTGQRDNIIKGLVAAEAFFPRMERIFSRVGVPSDLTRISLVESSFNLKAVSKAGATGVWQFMLRTGKEFLLIDPDARIDERLSPLKSAIAAAKLLKRNFRNLNRWDLAVTAYNSGTRGLRDLPPSGFDPCNKKSPLGWAGRNYYAEFLAVLRAEKYRDVFYGTVPESRMPQAMVFRPLKREKTGISLAMEQGISLHEFRLLNPDIRDLGRNLPVGLWVALPGPSDDFNGLTRSVGTQRHISVLEDRAVKKGAQARLRSRHRAKQSRSATKAHSRRSPSPREG